MHNALAPTLPWYWSGSLKNENRTPIPFGIRRLCSHLFGLSNPTTGVTCYPFPTPLLVICIYTRTSLPKDMICAHIPFNQKWCRMCPDFPLSRKATAVIRYGTSNYIKNINKSQKSSHLLSKKLLPFSTILSISL